MHETISTSKPFETACLSTSPAPKIPVKLLIVEDDEDLARLLQYNLKKEFAEVVIADNGRNGLEFVEKEHPDLVLLDVMMPELNGWEVCRRIRSHGDPVVAATPVIMLTALGDDDNKFKGLELGANLFVRKPYSMREVTLLCRNFLCHRQVRHDIAHRTGAAETGGRNSLYQLLFHELRTQVVVIGSLSQRLCRNSDKLSEKERIYAETIRKSSNYLEKLSDDVGLLELISNRECRLPNERFRITELIEEIAELMKPHLEKKEISLTSEFRPPDLSLILNRKALQVVVSTFLENSVKYCLEGSRIEVCGFMEGDRTVLRFHDNGPGIAKEEQSEIFRKYYRGKVLRSKEPGTGLGLFFARSLTEALGGRITVESDPGAGATFSLAFEGQLPDGDEGPDQPPCVESEDGGANG